MTLIKQLIKRHCVFMLVEATDLFSDPKGVPSRNPLSVHSPGLLSSQDMEHISPIKLHKY